MILRRALLGLLIAWSLVVPPLIAGAALGLRPAPSWTGARPRRRPTFFVVAPAEGNGLPCPVNDQAGLNENDLEKAFLPFALPHLVISDRPARPARPRTAPPAAARPVVTPLRC